MIYPIFYQQAALRSSKDPAGSLGTKRQCFLFEIKWRVDTFVVSKYYLKAKKDKLITSWMKWDAIQSTVFLSVSWEDARLWELMAVLGAWGWEDQPDPQPNKNLAAPLLPLLYPGTCKRDFIWKIGSLSKRSLKTTCLVQSWALLLEDS